MQNFAHPGLAEPRTKAEWRGYLDNRPPERPVMPPHDVYEALSDDERETLNDTRLDYHSALAIIRTPQMKDLHSAIDRKIRLNAYQAPGARRGVVLDGPPTVGKSTLVKMFAADHERRLRRKHPERFADGYQVDDMCVDYTPVVYLNIPAQATPKDLSVLLADYLGMPYRAGATKTDITKNVLNVMRISGVELVIIDDVHFLDLSAKEGKVVNDHLKYIANHTAATFVYTGADLKKSGLFLEGRGSTRATQTSNRNTLYAVTRFGFQTAKQQQEWAGAVMSLEGTLELYRHRPNHLVKLSSYLYKRTGGSICALSDLIRESAIAAVLNGEEAITRRLMDTIQISEFSEAAYRESVRRPVVGRGNSQRQAAEAV
ncbi:TniB family NTP-binding protein [Streptomyces sp. NPDC051561]|uniref:TniB family NTP-binding protein n=1 Tax=Streptomyces sp. NPDC051561 TaxID=3365658 RepID=UPI0037900E96